MKKKYESKFKNYYNLTQSHSYVCIILTYRLFTPTKYNAKYSWWYIVDNSYTQRHKKS